MGHHVRRRILLLCVRVRKKNGRARGGPKFSMETTYFSLNLMKDTPKIFLENYIL